MEENSIVMSWNYFLAEKIRDFAGFSEILDMFVIFIAEYSSYLIPVTLVILFLRGKKDRKDSIFVFLVTIIAIEISYIVSELYYHPRPFELYETLLSRVPQNTFPSQHAATFYAFAFAFLYRQRLKIGVFFVTLSVINSLARIYVGFHFPLDIIAGAVIGIIALLALSKLEKYVEDFSEWTEKLQKNIVKYLKRLIQ